MRYYVRLMADLRRTRKGGDSWLFEVLGNYFAAARTVHVEAVGVIRPAGNLGAFLRQYIPHLEQR